MGYILISCQMETQNISHSNNPKSMDQQKSKRHKIQTNFIIGTNSCNLKKMALNTV